jgi:hypothetical protein
MLTPEREAEIRKYWTPFFELAGKQLPIRYVKELLAEVDRLRADHAKLADRDELKALLREYHKQVCAGDIQSSTVDKIEKALAEDEGVGGEG